MGQIISYLFRTRKEDPFEMDAVEQISDKQFYSSSTNKKALLIGINYDKNQSDCDDLRGCENDTYRVRKFLIDRLEFQENQITTLSTDDSTRANLEHEILRLVDYAKQNGGSELFFHFSGHGASIEGGSESDGRLEALCPTDYHQSGMILDKWLKTNFLERLPCDCRLFCLVDCCHSGTNMNLPYSFDTIKACSRRDFDNTPCAAEIVKISGCLDNQVSYDYYEKKIQMFNGAMTNAFITTFNPDSDFKSIISRMTAHLKSQKFPQLPNLTSSLPELIDFKMCRG